MNLCIIRAYYIQNVWICVYLLMYMYMCTSLYKKTVYILARPLASMCFEAFYLSTFKLRGIKQIERDKWKLCTSKGMELVFTI